MTLLPALSDPCIVKNGEKNGDGYILPVVGDQRYEPTMSIKKSGKYARAYVESSRHCYTGLSGSSKSQTGRNQETKVFFFVLLHEKEEEN